MSYVWYIGLYKYCSCHISNQNDFDAQAIPPKFPLLDYLSLTGCILVGLLRRRRSTSGNNRNHSTPRSSSWLLRLFCLNCNSAKWSDNYFVSIATQKSKPKTGHSTSWADGTGRKTTTRVSPRFGFLGEICFHRNQGAPTSSWWPFEPAFTKKYKKYPRNSINFTGK